MNSVAQLPHLRFGLLQPYQEAVTHGIFTRHGGVSGVPFDSLNVSYSVRDDPAAVAENRKRCTAALGLAIAQVTTAGLVHGASVAEIAGPASTALPDGSSIVGEVDALITATPGRALLITAADCLQVVLFDCQTPAIGLVHAGWRGLVAGVLCRTVQAMQRAFGSRPEALLAGIGPGLGPCCARFSDPARELPLGFQSHVRGNYVDLWAIARGQLATAGLPPAAVEQQALCTVCHRDRFFSHRGDQGRTGRFAAIVALRTPLADRVD